MSKSNEIIINEFSVDMTPIAVKMVDNVKNNPIEIRINCYAIKVTHGTAKIIEDAKNISNLLYHLTTPDNSVIQVTFSQTRKPIILIQQPSDGSPINEVAVSIGTMRGTEYDEATVMWHT